MRLDAGARTRPNLQLDHILAHGPWQTASHRRTRHRLVVLAYHDVPDPVVFGRQLDHLLALATPVNLLQVISCALHAHPLPYHPFLVTFDDGHISILEHALPELKARGIPGVAFVVSDAVGDSRPHWWDEVAHLVGAGGKARALPGSPPPANAIRTLKRVPDAERRHALEELRETASVQAPPTRQLAPDDLRSLERGGVAVGSHTASHPCLHRCTTDVIEAEIYGARQRLHDLLGHSPAAFAYPNGDHDPRVRRTVEDAGHQVAFCFDHRTSPIPPPDPLLVSRVRVDASASFDRFASIVSGLHPAIHHLLRRP